jgi:hypothetical protein
MQVLKCIILHMCYFEITYKILVRTLFYQYTSIFFLILLDFFKISPENRDMCTCSNLIWWVQKTFLNGSNQCKNLKFEKFGESQLKIVHDSSRRVARISANYTQIWNRLIDFLQVQCKWLVLNATLSSTFISAKYYFI